SPSSRRTSSAFRSKRRCANPSESTPATTWSSRLAPPASALATDAAERIASLTPVKAKRVASPGKDNGFRAHGHRPRRYVYSVSYKSLNSLVFQPRDHRGGLASALPLLVSPPDARAAWRRDEVVERRTEHWVDGCDRWAGHGAATADAKGQRETHAGPGRRASAQGHVSNLDRQRARRSTARRHRLHDGRQESTGQ